MREVSGLGIGAWKQPGVAPAGPAGLAPSDPAVCGQESTGMRLSTGWADVSQLPDARRVAWNKAFFVLREPQKAV